MSQGTWRLLAVGVVTIVAFFTLGEVLTLLLIAVLSIVYVRFTPYCRFAIARTARRNFYEHLNPIKSRLSSLKETKQTRNASRFYDIHRELGESLQKHSRPAISSVRTVNQYVEWHRKRYDNSKDGKEASNLIVPTGPEDRKKTSFLDTLKRIKVELSYETEVPLIDPIPSEEVQFFDKAASECRALFDDSLLDHEFALIYEQHKTRRLVEQTTRAMRNEIASAKMQAASAESAAKKASRQARAAKRKANQNNPSAF